MLNRDPRTCTCRISVTGNQPGSAPIVGSPGLSVWRSGNSVVSEQTRFPDGQFIDVYLVGDGSGGADQFTNPANTAIHPNGERTSGSAPTRSA